MLFRDARAKIEWAEKHIARLDERVRLLEESDVATVEINPQVGNEVIKHDVRDTGAIRDIALIAGDCFHNLKCALDYSWIEILTKFAPQSIGNKSKFPVYSTKDSLEAAVRSIGIDESSGRVLDVMLTKIQPYERGDFAIWPIHRLNIRDKHRLLIPTVLYSSVSGIETQDHMGKVSRNGFTAGTHQQAPWYIPMPLGTHVENKGKVSLSISFEDREPRRDDIVVFADSLSMYVQHFLRIVETLEALV